MAIVSVKEVQAGQSVNVRTGKKTYTRKFLVVADSASTTITEVMTASDENTAVTIPALGEEYTWDESTYVTSINAERVNEHVVGDDAGILFTVDVEYGRSDGTVNVGQDPTTLPKTVRFSSISQVVDDDVAFREDSGTWYKDALIENSAFELFDPAPQKDQAEFEITITRNEANFPFALASSMLNAVNDDDFDLEINHTGQTITIAEKTARVISISAEEASASVSATVTKYVVVTYTLRIKPSTWLLILTDNGTQEARWNATDSRYEISKILDENQQPVSKPVLLDGNGIKLDIPELPALAETITKAFDHYEPKDFEVFGFDA